jgi:hypothetical protein
VKWLAVTLTLLAVTAGLVAGIYLRDREPSHWLPPQRQAANADVKTMLLQMRCGGQCTYALLGNPRPDHWLARVDDGRTIKCFDINVMAFDTGDTRGVSGVESVHCDLSAPLQ